MVFKSGALPTRIKGREYGGLSDSSGRFSLEKTNECTGRTVFAEGRLKGENDPAAEAEEKVGKLVKAIVSPVSFVPMVLPGNFRAGLRVKRYVFMTVAP